MPATPTFDPASFVADSDSTTFVPDQPRGALRGIADLGLEVGSGAVKGVKFISDVAGANNPVSGVLSDIDKYVKDIQSAQAKGEDQRMAAIMAEAQDKGVWEQVKSAFSAAGEAPARSALGAVGTSIPTILASLIPGVREATWGARLAVLGGMGGAQGVGVVKGSIYDAVERRMLEAGASKEAAAAEAGRQQEYDSNNAANIALGAVLGIAAGATGFQPAAARLLGGETGRASARGLAGSMAAGLAKEVPFEAAQGGQEQFAQNVAEQYAGFGTPTWRGVAGQSALEGLLSAPGGLAGGAMDTMAPAAVPPVAEPAPTVADLGTNVPDLGTPAPADITPPTPEALHADLTAQHAAATQQATDYTTLLTTLQTAQQEGETKLAALNAEAKLDPGQRRIKSEILAEKKDMAAQVKEVKAKIEEVGGQLNAARTTIGALAPQLAIAQRGLVPAITPAADPTPLTFPSIDYPTAPTPYQATGSAADHARMAADFTDLTTSETRDVEFRRAEMQRGQQKQRELDAIAAARTEDLGRTPDQQIAAAAAATDETPTAMGEAFAKAKTRQPTEFEQIARAKQGVSAIFAAPSVPHETHPRGVTSNVPAAPATNIKDYIVEELAKKPGTAERKIKLAEQIDTAIGDITAAVGRLGPDMRKGVVATMVKARVGGKVSADVQAELTKHIEEVVASGVGLARTLYSKGAAEYAGPKYARIKALDENKWQVASNTGEVIGTYPTVEMARRVQKVNEKRWLAEHLKVQKTAAVTSAPTSESRAALTQDEFDTLPKDAQDAATNEYNRVFREKGTALIQRMRQLVGDRPELEIRTFSAKPGEPIGSYTRVGPLKAIVALATNAKEGLSVTDHEAYHVVEDWLLTAAEKKVVANALKDGKPLFAQLVAKLQQYDRENGTSLTDEVTAIPAEARAYAFEFWRRGEFKAEGALAKAWQKLKRFFERIVNAVNGLGFQSIEDVFVALDRGQMAEREMVWQGDGGAFQSVAGGQSWYRSALTEAVAGIQSKQASAQGWKDQIKGLIANGKAKQVELDAVGLNEWLDLQQGKVTKDQVVSFLKENGVQVRETVLGARPEYLALPRESKARIIEILNQNDMLGFETTGDARRAYIEAPQNFDIPEADRAELNALLGDMNSPRTKFAAYHLPGFVSGSYRELLLTLPSAQSAKDALIRPLADATAAWRAAVEEFGPGNGTEPALRAERMRLAKEFDEASAEAKQEFRSSHFDQPNILAHIRFNERTAEGPVIPFVIRETGGGRPWKIFVEGEEQHQSSYTTKADAEEALAKMGAGFKSKQRVLFIEEIQSDWAQKGRKEGFRKDSTLPNKPATYADIVVGDEIIGWGKVQAIQDGKFDVGGIWITPDKFELGLVAGRDRGHLSGGLHGNMVPSAPFVGKTEAWTALALKRMIRYAAENGFDSVAWTTGEQQFGRWGSEEVAWVKEGKGWRVSANEQVGGNAGGIDLEGEARARGILKEETGKTVTSKAQLREIVSSVLSRENNAEAIDKVTDRTWERMQTEDAGTTMPRREGMKGYYDKIVVGVANDILKKLGGGKVGEISVGLNTPTTTPGMTRVVRDDDGTYAVEVRKFDEGGESFWEPAAYGLTKEDAEARRLFGGQVPAMQQPGFTITPRLAEAAANGLPLFSKAAVAKANRMAAGELEAMQSGEQYAHLIENANLSNDLFRRAFGVVKEDIVGGLGRWWTNTMSTPNYISAASAGFKNVYQAFNTYSRYRKILAEQLVRERLPGWYNASEADRKAAFDVMLKRTVGKYSTSSLELADLLRPLTPAQRTLYDQATGMIAGVLQRQFDSQKETRRRQLTTPGEYEKWLAHRQEQMDSLLDTGYVPLRRYGDYSVSVYMEAPDGSRVQAGLEFFASPSAAKAASIAYAREIERSGVALKVELGRRSKNERDTGVSLEQFLGTLRRQGIDISQAERERLVVAMTNADSLVRTQMMRREGLAGYSTDGMRVLHEFGVNTTSEIAYARFAPVLDAALDGAEVTADVNSVTSEPIIQIGEAFGRREDGVENNLWKRDGPMSGFYKDRANAMADTTLSPDRQSEWATKLRTAGVMYFIGGSISGAAVNTLSIPMVLVPRLSIHTDYLNASMTSLKAWKDSWQHYNILRDMDRMKNPDAETAAKLDAAGITKEMRASIVAAADHIFDTEIHMMLGISQGSLYSKSRNVQRAAEAWMAPFRVAEQTNRLASFIAAYKVATTGDGVKQADGTFKRLSGQELFRFASETVDATQNNYNVNNRPGIMNNPVGALMFQFKSFPLFMIEAAALMYKQSPKSAVYMLLGLVAMSGVQGLPFAEEILNLVDVISQRLFGSPFNSRRAMRNAIKTASDAVGVMDLSDAVMRGVVNEITGVNIATRVSGGLLPGTRIGAADATEGRVLSEIAGAPYSMVKDALSNAGGAISGIATGDWQKTADALRAGGPIAVRNAIKGAEQLSQGYASDSKGRKVVDVSTFNGLLQLTGLSSAALTKAQDMQSIRVQVKSFHSQVSQDLQNQLVKAYRSGDQERIKDILDLRAKWNEQNPAMPIIPNLAATRRAIALAGMPLNRREQVLLGRRLGGAFADVTDQMAE